MDVRNLIGRVALVTGAGSGIGRATALACARRGARVVVCDVEPQGLSAIEEEIRALGCEVLARQVDIAAREEVRAFAEEVQETWGPVDLLVNNAGVGMGALFLETSLDDWEWIVRINCFGVIHGCHFFLPAMIERGRGGHVVNLSSMSGYFCLPAQSAYAATKFAVIGLSQGLRAELAPHGIGVTAVCPGFIDTPIVDSSRLRGVAADPDNMRRTKAFYQSRGYTPERVARNILRAVQRNRFLAPVAAEAWFVYWGMRLVPGLFCFLNRQIAKQALSPPRTPS